jgi:hypothetical protein
MLSTAQLTETCIRSFSSSQSKDNKSMMRRGDDDEMRDVEDGHRKRLKRR